MMKSLTILRHGKAIRSEDYPIDFERPLAKRGVKDANRIVKILRNMNPQIDWIMSSPALRAQQTAEIVAKQLGLQDQLILENAIYEDGSDALLALLEHVPSEKRHALIVGHNPTLEHIISGLCAGSINRMVCSLPTAGVANIELQIMWWEQVRWGSGVLRLFLRPRMLRNV